MPTPQINAYHVGVHTWCYTCTVCCVELAMAERVETHRNFDVTFKLCAIEVAEKTSKSNAAREFKVDVRRVREWCKQKEELVMKKKCGQSRIKRLNGGGRKVVQKIRKRFCLTGLRS